MRFANNDLMKNKLRSQELPALSCRLTITGDVSAMMFDLLVYYWTIIFILSSLRELPGARVPHLRCTLAGNFWLAEI